jgi:hypothetical protein
MFDIYTLELLRSIDKLRWAIDRKPEMLTEFSNKVKELIETNRYN